MANFVTRPIGDNVIITNKKPDDYNMTTVLFGAEMVIAGVNTGETERKTLYDSEGHEYFYEGPKIVGQQIYNLPTQVHKNWFVLDLETGQRCWYPGKPDESSEG